jgi:AcrR family transcriptional regulator
MRHNTSDQSSAGRPRGDHDWKRQGVAEATWRVLRDHGLEGASLRKIARAAGCSTGALVHYFEDKEDLLGYAMTLAFDKLRARLRKAAEGRSPLEALRAMALVALPIDEESELQWRVWLVFLASTTRESDFGKQARRSAEAIRREVERLLKRGIDERSIRPDLDVVAAAERLLIGIDGLALRARFDPRRYTNKRLREVVDGMIDQFAECDG